MDAKVNDYILQDFLLNAFIVRYPKDWDIPTNFNCSIYGWGHNHRGQLGGVDGNKVKVPRICEAFGEINPVQITGGEQTLFAVTADGKVSMCMVSPVCVRPYVCMYVCMLHFAGLCYWLWGVWSAGCGWDRQHHVTHCVIHPGFQGDQGEQSRSSLRR